MEDERRGIEPNGIIKFSNGSESTTTCTKTNNTNSTNKDDNNNNNNNNNGKEQDRFLPIANVGRIMKKVIPGNGKISKDAKETVQECVSEFISFITGEASDKCQREKRKTINGDDIIWAITTLGFEDYVSPLKLYLQKYRELEGEKLNVPKQQQQQQLQQQRGGDHQIDNNQSNLQASDYNNNCVYSTTNLLPPQPPTYNVSNDQTFPLQFNQNSIPTQLTQHEQMDQWGIGN